ncbi:MAG: oligogalacturonate lyase family protein [Planctomycetota bacterium]
MHEAVRITADHRCNDQLLYFTSTSLSADDRTLFFLSDRTGAPNLFCRPINTAEGGADRQLTRNDAGYLKSYVYFDGRTNEGFGRASVSLHAPSQTAYYLQGLAIRCVDAAGRERTLAMLPSDQVTAFTHVSTDGRFLCVPTTDARALEGYERERYDIDARVQSEALNSTLRVFDTDSGAQVVCERVPRAWITHVQFDPTDSRRIMYNHEWPADCGVRRMWLFDGATGTHRRLREAGAGRSAADWTCHEVFDRTGRYIYYHGSYHQGVGYVGRIDRSTGGMVELGFPTEYKRYGHFTARGDGLLVSDGYYQDGSETETPRQGAWISLQRCDWSAGRIDWVPLCRHGSSWDSQDSHPHPIFSHRGDAVLFTSDREGHRAVYQVGLEAAFA